MAVAANEVHRRTIAAYVALKGNPELGRFMQSELRERLVTLAERLISLIAVAEDDQARKEMVAQVECAFRHTRDVLSRVQSGIRFFYAPHPDLLDRLGPLKLGADPAEDQARLAHVRHEIPEIAHPAFTWPTDLGPADIDCVLRDHDAAQTTLDATNHSARDAARQLRELRPDSVRLWDEHGLDAWIAANVKGTDAQTAWGRARRRRGRAKSGGNAIGKNAENPFLATSASGPNGSEPDLAGSVMVTTASEGRFRSSATAAASKNPFVERSPAGASVEQGPIER
ncbi:MAG: hypothetical protein AB2A00_35060 [Myxococcota bacterium]